MMTICKTDIKMYEKLDFSGILVLRTVLAQSCISMKLFEIIKKNYVLTCFGSILHSYETI